MAVFRYKAAAGDGHIVEGTVEAADLDLAARVLQDKGQLPLHIENDATPPFALSRRPHTRRLRLGESDIDIFTLELATLLRAELTLSRSLDALANGMKDAALAERAAKIHELVRGGRPLSDALAESGPEFDGFYCNMVRAGESGGALGLALERLAGFRRRRRETRQAIVSALLYPAILLVLAVVSVAILLAFVVPQFSQMFADAGRELPLLTRMVAATGEFVTHWWWAILAVVGACSAWCYHDWRSATGRIRWSAWLLRLPYIGTLVSKTGTARFARTLSTLLGNGVHLLAALEIAREVVGNATLSNALGHAIQRVRAGTGLAGPLAESGVLPPLAVRLIGLGETSGRLDFMLSQIADIYDADVQAGLKRLFTLAEPVIIIVIALLISVIVLSVVLVILDSNNLAF